MGLQHGYAHPPIPGSALFGSVAVYRIELAHAHGLNALGVYAVGVGQVAEHGEGAGAGEFPVGREARPKAWPDALSVCVALNTDAAPLELCAEAAREFIQTLLALRLQVWAPALKEHVRKKDFYRGATVRVRRRGALFLRGLLHGEQAAQTLVFEAQLFDLGACGRRGWSLHGRKRSASRKDNKNKKKEG